MENYAFNLHRQLARHNPVTAIVLGRSQRHLVWFIPWAVVAGLVQCLRPGTAWLYIGDAVLAPIGVLLGALTRVRTAVTVLGLDVVHPPRWYQALVRFCLPRFAAVLPISRATRAEALQRGAPPDRTRIVPCGVDAAAVRRGLPRPEARRLLGARLGMELGGRLLVLTVGRLVARKGVTWFVEQVLPRLPESACYLIAGTGPQQQPIERSIRALGLGGRAIVLGAVTDAERETLYDATDVFAMPNRHLEGNMEGFGIVLLEAGLHGVPVVAAAIEGIVDAVLPGRTGLLVREGDGDAFARAIVQCADWPPAPIVAAVTATYTWEAAYRELAAALHLDSRDPSPPSGS
jgi:glycosyltransferase involved in cell wall biosynthesis